MFEQPLDVLKDELDEMRNVITFAQIAFRLRPQTGNLMYGEAWDALDQHLQQPWKDFVAQKDFALEILYRQLWVPIGASFEKCVREIIVNAVGEYQKRVGSYDELDEWLQNKNIQMSGQVFVRVFDKPDEIDLDMNGLVTNLGSCQRGNKKFRLNADAFAVFLPNLTESGIENAMKRVGVALSWSDLCRRAALQTVLGTGTVKDAERELKHFVAVFSKRRNQLAHGSRGQVQITEAELSRAIAVVREFAIGIAGTVERFILAKTA